MLIVALCVQPHTAQASDFGRSEIVQKNGWPVFEVQSKPFFVYGASFFYERIPRPLWRPSLEGYKALGINTIDLYLIWNWHELQDGEFDFTGRTDPRRDLHGLLQLIHELGFRTILRPGPVIRNEWRNGGYPAWLLKRPEYNMPLHDVLEGRYPATATLQNAHSDDAAKEWTNNPTHMRYADRWLRRVLSEVRPWAGDAIAIALDDDQGAYLDNQTWPAPHFEAYLNHLASVVRVVAGPKIPLFINTYQMKVTASAPVWAWGNWYQSEAYRLGDHDRVQLEFSTALLGTQPRFPVMSSEFQAGWLQGPDQGHPRHVAPENTSLALHTLLQSGARGVVNFPVQDTLYPGGWEVPFANASYAWDAALTLDGRHNARYGPTREFGRLVARYGPLLAQTHRAADAAIAYTVSAYDPQRMDNASVDTIAGATMGAQKDCRTARLTCDLVDPRYASHQDLARYAYLIVPPTGTHLRFTADVTQKLRRFARHGKLVQYAREVNPRSRAVNIADAVLAVGDGVKPFGFLDIVNYGSLTRRTGRIILHFPSGQVLRLPSVRVAPGSGSLIPINLPPRAARAQRNHLREARASVAVAVCPGKSRLRFAGVCWRLPPNRTTPIGTAIAYNFDILQDGEPWLILANSAVRLGISPAAGARAFVFQQLGNSQSAAISDGALTTTGALRDDVEPAPTPSPRDYIGQYTHQFPAGTFNRPYDCRILQSGVRAEAACTYTAPDLGVSFERTITMRPEQPSFTLRMRMMPAAQNSHAQGVLINSFSITRHSRRLGLAAVITTTAMRYSVGTSIAVQGNILGIYDAAARKLATIDWRATDPLNVAVDEKPDTAIVRVRYAANTWHELSFGYYAARDLDDAERIYNSLKGRNSEGANRR